MSYKMTIIDYMSTQLSVSVSLVAASSPAAALRMSSLCLSSACNQISIVLYNKTDTNRLLTEHDTCQPKWVYCTDMAKGSR